jgi:hypothetical protein
MKSTQVTAETMQPQRHWPAHNLDRTDGLLELIFFFLASLSKLEMGGLVRVVPECFF